MSVRGSRAWLMFQNVQTTRVQDSILYLGRIAPSKYPDVLIEALGELKKKGVVFSADIFGDALPEDQKYLALLKKRADELALSPMVHFHDGVPNRDTPAIYTSHGIFVNLSKSGMYDKTIFEAAAAGCLPVASSKDYAVLADQQLTFDGTASHLVTVLEKLIRMSESDRDRLRKGSFELAAANSLETLGERLAQEIK